MNAPSNLQWLIDWRKQYKPRHIEPATGTKTMWPVMKISVHDITATTAEQLLVLQLMHLHDNVVMYISIWTVTFVVITNTGFEIKPH